MAKKQISPEAQAILSASDAGLFATTVSLVEKFLLDNPDSQRAWLDLGLAQGQLGRYEAAEKAFLKVVEIDESNGEESPAIFGEIGNLYRSKGDFETAISWYEKQIKADPGDSVGYLYVGNLLMRQGKFTEAIELFQKARACDGVCLEEVHYSIGFAYRSIGNYTEAKTQFELSVNYDQHFADGKVALRDVSALTGK